MPSRNIFLKVMVFCAVSGFACSLLFPARVRLSSANRFFSAKLISGSECILSMTDFEKRASEADLVITGEGKMDFQSIMGKVPFAVAKKSGSTKVIAFVGLNEADIKDVRRNGISEVYETNPLHLPFSEIKDKAEEMLRETAGKILL